MPRPNPKRLRAFWILGVFPAVLAFTTGVIAAQKAADAGPNGWRIAAGGFAAGCALLFVFGVARTWWRSSIRRFPRPAILAAIAVAAIAPFWSVFGTRIQAGTLAFGSGFLATTAVVCFVTLARTRPRD